MLKAAGVLLSLMAAIAFTLLMRSFGTKGNDLLALISGVVFLAGGLSVIILPLLPSGRAATANGEVVSPVRSRRRHWIWALAVLVAIGGTWLGWDLSDRTNINVTADMAAPSNPVYRDGTIQLTVPGNPPVRDNLAITLQLRNPGATGNCVRPARLELTALVDGVSQKPTTVSSGEEAELSLAGVSRDAQILVTLKHPDSACPLVVTVQRALLFN
jgi:hypothetical protein